jgi:hypothetical protein
MISHPFERLPTLLGYAGWKVITSIGCPPEMHWRNSGSSLFSANLGYPGVLGDKPFLGSCCA